MPQQEVTFESIFKELKAKKYYPIYYLMGEEPYYIDLISDYIANHVLTETEKEFNQTIVYGADTDIASVINAAKRYPMMSEYQVVIVKEAQALRNLDELSYYLQKPLISTILVICHKHGALDKRKKLAIEIEKKEKHMLTKYLIVFFVAMVPLIELRGAIPIAEAMNLPFVQYYIIAILGNMLPVPVIYFFARKVLIWGADKPVIGKFFSWCLEKGERGGKKLQEKENEQLKGLKII